MPNIELLEWCKDMYYGAPLVRTRFFEVCPPIRRATYCPMRDFLVILTLAIRQLHHQTQICQSLEMCSSEAQLYTRNQPSYLAVFAWNSLYGSRSRMMVTIPEHHCPYPTTQRARPPILACIDFCFCHLIGGSVRDCVSPSCLREGR